MNKHSNMNVLSVVEIEKKAGPHYTAQAIFGYISGMSDDVFLPYILKYRENAIVRRAFFSQLKKRPTLPTKEVDNAAGLLIDEILDGRDRVRNETLLRRLIPTVSEQMRAKIVNFALSAGTKLIRRYVLREVSPADTPDVAKPVLALALHQNNQDALFGIVYRWPLVFWKDHIDEIFKATQDLPWLQRQVIFKTGDADRFLRKQLISDPVTELYIRVKYRYPISRKLIHSAIDSAESEHLNVYDTLQRTGLIAWCLAYIGAIDDIPRLPTVNHSQAHVWDLV